MLRASVYHSAVAANLAVLLVLASTAVQGGAATAQEPSPPTPLPEGEESEEPSPPAPLPEGEESEEPSPPTTEEEDKAASATPPPSVAARPDGRLRRDAEGEWKKRSAPDYDGRGEEPTTAGDVLIWIPRVILSPLYLVSEYVIRRPLGALTTAAEKGRWHYILFSVFTFGEERKTGLFPTFFYDFGLEPSVGLYFFSDDVGMEGHDIRVHGGMWPPDWWTLTFKDRLSAADDARSLAVSGNLTQRPDFLFTGIGPESDGDDEGYYEATVAQGGLEYYENFWRNSSLGVYSGIRSARFEEDSDFEDASLADRVAEGAYALPPGFDDGYAAWRQEIALIVDTRLPRPAPGHGARLELNADHAWDFQLDRGHRWVHYGGVLGGFWDIFGEHRVVSLSLNLAFADPIEGQLPFSELSSLGGGGQPLFQGLRSGLHEPMEGFPAGRLLGRSACAATFEYRWPVWIWLDMAAHFALGNVFGAGLAGFEWDLLRASFGLGLRSSVKVDSSLNLLLAFGTETFREGTGLDSVRFVFGFSRGF
jgi:hypothetical protein